jgi:protein-S-isoprenylcysteine O-methyltransferase Ste14
MNRSVPPNDPPSDDEGSAGGPAEETPPGTILAPSPLLSLGAFLVGVGIEQVWPSELFSWAWNLPVGVVLIAGGGVLFGGALWTMRGRGKHPSHSDEPPELITDGPFRYSRNPIYVGHSLVHVGGSVLVDSVWPLVTLVPLLFYLRHVVRQEEARLEALFGEQYDRYRQRVRRWL